MIGIVLWSDPVDCKAVFWCEDQGDLAYFEGQAGQCDYFDAGDMVQFDVSAERMMRLAHQPKLLHQQICAELPERLRDAAPTPGTGAGQPSAQIIPFAAQDTPEDHGNAVKKA